MATMGTSEHSRKRQVWTIQMNLINLFFRDFENDKNYKTISRFYIDVRQSCLKTSGIICVVLEVYGPVNNEVMSSRSVNIGTFPGQA